MRRVLRFLRSPKTAAWLIIAVVAYAALATIVPQTGLESPEEVASWRADHRFAAAASGALGLHDAYTTPLFLSVVALLVCSLAVCSYDRTRLASRLTRLARQDPDIDISTQRWNITGLVVGVRRAETVERVAEEFRLLGLSVRVFEHGIRGTSSVWAAWGSAAFHWCLVGLFVSAGVGQLVRWEAEVGVPVGYEVSDTAGVYPRLLRGALAPTSPSSGLTFAVPEMTLDHDVGGGAKGHAPFARLTRGGEPLAEGLVFPNHPLTAGAIALHRGEWGLAVVAALLDEKGQEVGRRNYLFDFESTGGTGRLIFEEDVPPEIGIARIRLGIPLDPAAGGLFNGDLPADPRVEVTALRPTESSTTVMQPGDVHSFSEGALRLKIIDVTRYARFTVVNDPSLPFLYAFFALAVAGSVVALLFRTRIVFASLEDVDDGCRVRAAVIAKRIDPLFREEVESAIRGIATQGDEHGSA